MSQTINIAYHSPMDTASYNKKLHEILGENGVLLGFNAVPGTGRAIQISHSPDTAGLLFINGVAIGESAALTTNIAIAANVSGSTRTDVLYAYYDHGTTSECSYVVGTGSLTPPAPTLACKIAEIDVPNNASTISVGNIRNATKLKTVRSLTDSVNAYNKFADGGATYDNNGNELFKYSVVGSAVNEVTVRNAITGTAPGFSATGGDANIDFNIIPKGTGKLKVNGNQVWHSGNQGIDSTMDSDLLDSQHGAYYLAWANFTGIPGSFPPSMHGHADATGSAAGFLPSVDKTKLDSVSANAQPNSAITKGEIEAKLIGDVTSHSHGVYQLKSAMNSWFEVDALSTALTAAKKADASAWSGQCGYLNTVTTGTVDLASVIFDNLRFGKYTISVRVKTANKSFATGLLKIDALKNVTGTYTSIKSTTFLSSDFATNTDYQMFFADFEYTGAKATNNQLKIVLTLLTQTVAYEVDVDSITVMPATINVFGA